MRAGALAVLAASAALTAADPAVASHTLAEEGSPPAVEYALPYEQARERGSSGGPDDARRFGAGIVPETAPRQTQGPRPSAGEAPADSGDPSGKPRSRRHPSAAPQGPGSSHAATQAAVAAGADGEAVSPLTLLVLGSGLVLAAMGGGAAARRLLRTGGEP